MPVKLSYKTQFMWSNYLQILNSGWTILLIIIFFFSYLILSWMSDVHQMKKANKQGYQKVILFNLVLCSFQLNANLRGLELKVNSNKEHFCFALQYTMVHSSSTRPWDFQMTIDNIAFIGWNVHCVTCINLVCDSFLENSAHILLKKHFL